MAEAPVPARKHRWAIPLSLVTAVLVVTCGCQRPEINKLMAAVESGNTQSVRTELDKGFNPERLNSLDGQDVQITPLHLAALRGDAEVAALLLERGVKSDITLANGTTPLMMAASQGHTDVVKLLLRRGANANAFTSPEHIVPLVFACQGGYKDSAQALIEGGANINGSSGGVTPLEAAIQASNADMVKFLIATGAQPTTFIDAQMAQKTNNPAIAKLIRAADPANRLLKRSAELQSQWNELRQELAAFLLNAKQTGVLDKAKLAEYQAKLQSLEQQMEAVVGGKP